ncbi:MAG: YIP1 family protein [Cyclobacteriaceae bacterium]|nr:YIP1 family protein [Cyclobacteriaceae bacterium]
MNLIDRAKNILLTPKTEWPVIAGESATLSGIFTSYALPLIIVSSIGSLLSGVLFTGALGFGITYAIKAALITFIAATVSFFVSVYVVDWLAPQFNSEKDLNKSAQLVAYANTPSYLAGALTFIPVLNILIQFAGAVYAIYLIYLGLGPIKKTPEDKKVVYLIVTFVVLIGLSMLIGAILTSVLLFV